MTITAALILNGILGIAIVGALGLVVRLAHLLPEPGPWLYRTHGLPFRARSDERQEHRRDRTYARAA